MKKWICLLALSAFSLPALSGSWQVNSQDSRVSFVSVKKGDIAEVHYFKEVNGSLDGSGDFVLTIPLISVNTGVEIRDERMQSMLFEVAQFPQMTLSSRIDPAGLESIKAGEVSAMSIEAKINLHGKTQIKVFNVLVAKLSETKIVVSSLQPVVVNGSEFELTAGIEKLREIAGLSAISQAVPVSFVLTLDK